jgi:hypothetical protein
VRSFADLQLVVRAPCSSRAAKQLTSSRSTYEEALGDWWAD